MLVVESFSSKYCLFERGKGTILGNDLVFLDLRPK